MINKEAVWAAIENAMAAKPATVDELWKTVCTTLTPTEPTGPGSVVVVGGRAYMRTAEPRSACWESVNGMVAWSTLVSWGVPVVYAPTDGYDDAAKWRERCNEAREVAGELRIHMAVADRVWPATVNTLFGVMDRWGK